ncbi:uncharacterized protein MONBRDRAFT_22554 [Monosiga brevicollis MX1]|uniref:Coiled-coil domain-containing protein 181 n=1 Tax=Monosiga brevicollis TaxID=81824 RepID=A9UQX4_MONBE|nr:uncharacterized protein MONBRDRAFT_22554 [Monosiga brevicollis MX1]EDQ93121.1 predicted protein [Monosiga brevicollis MX1]|eukprot:XP_001742883.1 hypothetical protein [Monosiga brevicollis MX1]
MAEDGSNTLAPPPSDGDEHNKQVRFSDMLEEYEPSDLGRKGPRAPAATTSSPQQVKPAAEATASALVGRLNLAAIISSLPADMSGGGGGGKISEEDASGTNASDLPPTHDEEHLSVAATTTPSNHTKAGDAVETDGTALPIVTTSSQDPHEGIQAPSEPASTSAPLPQQQQPVTASSAPPPEEQAPPTTMTANAEAATASQEPDMSERESVVIARGGKIEVVDADAVTVHPELRFEDHEEDADDSAPLTRAARAPPRPLRAQSARPHRSRPTPAQTSDRPRPASAAQPRSHTRIAHTASFTGPGKGLHRFASEEARDAFEAWYARKQRSMRDTLRANSSSDPEAERQRQLESQRSFEAWRRRKDEEEREERRRQRQREDRRNPAHSRAASASTQQANRAYHEWLQRKRSETKQAQLEQQIRQQLLDESQDLLTERETLVQSAVQDWLSRKRYQEQLEKEQLKERLREERREMQRIKQSLARTWTTPSRGESRTSTTFDASFRLQQRDERIRSHRNPSLSSSPKSFKPNRLKTM